VINLEEIIRQAKVIAGPPPAGDPALLRDLARQYRHRAVEVHEQRKRAATSHAQMQFEGPVADRLRQKVEQDCRLLDRLADQLTDLADFLDRAAERLAADQRLHQTTFVRIKDRLLAEAERAARSIVH
jgi:uncharacterized protein YukE